MIMPHYNENGIKNNQIAYHIVLRDAIIFGIFCNKSTDGCFWYCQHIDEYNPFITLRRHKSDIKKAKNIGREQCNLGQKKKMAIDHIQSDNRLPTLLFKTQCFYLSDVFRKITDRRNIELKFIKKK